MRAPRPSRPVRTLTATWLAGLVLLAVAAPAALAEGPPFGSPPPADTDTQVYDTADALLPATRINAEGIADAVEGWSGAEVIVYTQQSGIDEPAALVTQDNADALLSEWEVGGDAGTGVVVFVDRAEDGRGAVAIAIGPGMQRWIDESELAAIRAGIAEYVDAGDVDNAVIVGLSEVIRETLSAEPEPGIPSGPTRPEGAPPPGPPFPDPVVDQAVYDFAGVFDPATIAQAETTIDEIEARTGAEIAVYSQVVDYGVTTEETERRARALIDQWGIGRVGFDDGMVVFFDLDPSLEHGQVQLYAAPGFEATFLDNAARQRVFDEDMLPYLQDGDLDQALLVAMEQIDKAATPANAARLQLGRQINAVLGLILAPTVFLVLAGWAFFSWRRYGKDPVYLDDPSILMPAPPPDLTAASGAFVLDGGTSRRALTTAMLDLASRGLIAFREEKGLLGLSTKVGVDTAPTPEDAMEQARQERNARRPTGPAEAVALRRLRALDGGEHFIAPDDLPKFGAAVDDFDRALEGHVVDKGWLVERPSKVVSRWVGRGVIAIVAGGIGIFLGFNIPASGLVLVGGAAIAGGIVICLFAQGMPTVTMPGATVRAMLAAYKRTLSKTMDQARSMQQVVDGAGLTWLETPDQAVVWGTALGLQHEIEGVLSRSLEDVSRGAAAASSTYFPTWYRGSDGSSFASAAASGSGGSIFSGSAVPDLGGMMSALGTIGNSPSSSGSGGSGGGGFSGGGSGGGGGGAGGGF
jgi:uncharacterized membrane protein YgcG